MKRVIFLMLLALSSFVFTSCDPWYPTWDIRERFFVENNTEMPIILELCSLEPTGWGGLSDTTGWHGNHPYLCPLEDGDFEYYSGSRILCRVRSYVNPFFSETEIFSVFFRMIDKLDDCTCYGIVSLYNLQDTTVFSFSAYEEGMPFVEHVWMQDTTDMRPRADYVSEFYITVTDSNLAAMQKDYSMLEKFPQYYGGQGK